ncbi:metallo-beta-lactamase family protein [Panacagrimonas perspica]|uniref:Metallo-beta-lactamase family protein n=1 Tax=Panacagrimonas perspica TaxID=381431 RepID=A0A4R7PEE7_9GAMM|nr:MBL fold metallo-hydrolase [Panacagrimonas perspica]TDU31660.1 metallo-beta-lactamase family protein [Panacagrimonas perspica]THD03119.1 MBL fold metallo-hydrolase [Panacagrimonas perspica]
MKIQFCGATGTVTGSRYVLTHRDRRLLVDCGLFQGYKQLRLRNWARPPFDPAAIEAVLLTHAHLDHSGYLPLLMRRGFAGPILCSKATRDLCRILLPDSGRIQEEDAERANRRHYSKHSPAKPLYTEADAVRVLEQFVVRDMDADFEPLPGLNVRMLPAGHLLGSAMILIDDGHRRVLFSGDVGRPGDAIMREPSRPPSADVLILESTYGDRLHDPADPQVALGQVVRRVADRGGVVVVPAFSVGRAQTLLWYLHCLRENGGIPRAIPIYLNSPMAIDATAIYRRHHREHRLSADQCAQMCGVARMVNTVEESRALNLRRDPMILIAGSGMATGGRVIHHLRAFAPDPANAIVLTGFQAGGTRGAALLAGADTLKIHGEHVPVRAEVVSISNLSAHADYAEMIRWLETTSSPPGKTYLTHGEPAAADALRLRIQESLGWDCTIPEYLESVEV